MKAFFRSLCSQRRIAGGAAVLATTQLLASVCGFLRDRAFSTMFPLGEDPLGVASVYIAAFRPSDLLFQITVMSCLSVVLVPFLASHLSHGKREEMNEVTSSTLTIFGGVFGIIALILAAMLPKIAPHLVQFTGESLALYVRFARIALVTNFFFVAGATFGQYLISIQKYWMYGLTPVLWSLSTIAGTYFLTPSIGAYGPIVGTLIGTVLYVLLRLVAIRRAGFFFTLSRTSIVHADLHEMGLLIIPRMAALGALQLQLLLLDRMASGLSPGMVALNQFASNFESVIPGIVGISLAQSAFSSMSQSAARGDTKGVRAHMRQGILINILMTIPAATALAVLGSLAAWMLDLDAGVSGIFIASLHIYVFAIPFESINHLMLRAYYAMKNTTLPALSSIVSCTLAVSTGAFLLPTYGIYALAIAYVTAQIAQTILLSLAMRTLLPARS